MRRLILTVVFRTRAITKRTRRTISHGLPSSAYTSLYICLVAPEPKLLEQNVLTEHASNYSLYTWMLNDSGVWCVYHTLYV